MSILGMCHICQLMTSNLDLSNMTEETNDTNYADPRINDPIYSNWQGLPKIYNKNTCLQLLTQNQSLSLLKNFYGNLTFCNLLLHLYSVCMS